MIKKYEIINTDIVDLHWIQFDRYRVSINFYSPKMWRWNIGYAFNRYALCFAFIAFSVDVFRTAPRQENDRAN